MGYVDVHVELDKIDKTIPLNFVLKGNTACAITAERIEQQDACSTMGVLVIHVNEYHSVEYSSLIQDPPHGRTFPKLIRDWIQNLKEKRSERKPKPQPEPLPSPIENTRVVENKMPDIRPPQIVNKKLITNIFPNPFDDKIHLRLESETVETLRVVVYDAMSREIHEEQINVLIGTNEIDLNLKGKQLTNGSYFVSIFRGNEVIQTEILTRTK